MSWGCNSSSCSARFWRRASSILIAGSADEADEDEPEEDDEDCCGCCCLEGSMMISGQWLCSTGKARYRICCGRGNSRSCEEME